MKATILLAEDERDMREVLCDYFTAKSGGDMLFIHSSFFLRGLGEFTVRIRAILAVLFVQLCFLEELK